jgi:hypothetical protein
MDLYQGLGFERFKEKDIELFTEIMKRAFDEDSRRHLNAPAGGPPGYDNGDFLRKWALDKNSQSFKVYKDKKPIGLFIVWINGNNENFLGNMFIDPDIQDKGLGAIVWKYIEQKYPETIMWRTETPGFSKRNHNFYVNKCGFAIVKIENPKDIYNESYLMEKRMK